MHALQISDDFFPLGDLFYHLLAVLFYLVDVSLELGDESSHLLLIGSLLEYFRCEHRFTLFQFSDISLMISDLLLQVFSLLGKLIRFGLLDACRFLHIGYLVLQLDVAI